MVKLSSNMQPPRFPPDLHNSESIQRKLLEAARSLSALNAVVETIPNADLVTKLLPLEEARFSCALENIIVGQAVLFRIHSIGRGQKSDSVKDVLGYSKAIELSWDNCVDI